jgi:hypothetical protein
MGAGVAVALVAGVISAVVGRYFYVVLIFPIFIGCAVGGTQAFAIRATKIRTPLACGAAGLVAGVIAALTMHYADYGAFRQDMEDNAIGEHALQQALVAAEDDQEREMLSQLLVAFQEDPEVVEAKQVDSFFGYLDWNARQGVELTSTRGSSRPLNLGYIGSYVYWGIEALIVAVISAAMARGRAAEPFCVQCDAWKEQRELGALRAHPKVVASIIEGGRLADLPDVISNPREEAAISLYECPCCAGEEVVLQVDSVSYNNGSRVKSKVARAVYPKKVTEELASFFFAGEEVSPLCSDIDPETVRKLQAAANADTGELVAAAR